MLQKIDLKIFINIFANNERCCGGELYFNITLVLATSPAGLYTGSEFLKVSRPIHIYANCQKRLNIN